MPYTATTFAVGTFAIAGAPPLAAFWSQAESLAHTCGANKLLWPLLLLAAVLTALYMTRLLILILVRTPRCTAGVTPPKTRPPAPWPHPSTTLNSKPPWLPAISRPPLLVRSAGRMPAVRPQAGATALGFPSVL